MSDAAKDLFDMAFQEFLVSERENILDGTAEQNLAARLGYKLEQFKHLFGLENYNADPEYNRMQNRRIKMIIDEKMEVINIKCDLLLHGRGKCGPRENIIAIEMKKAGRKLEETLSDQKRLRALTTPPGPDSWSDDGETFPKYVCGYELGVFIEVDVTKATFRVEEYRLGACVDARNGAF
jgi:hypothetical protein